MVVFRPPAKRLHRFAADFAYCITSEKSIAKWLLPSCKLANTLLVVFITNRKFF